MLAYTTAHISVIALRIKEPDLPRPFRIPLNVSYKGKMIPVTAILGGLATGITWFIVVYTHEFGRIVGFAWIVIGVIIYILYRKSKHLPLIKIAPTAKEAHTHLVQ
jgi:APA family basic amino acid/polyamine antiporter